MQGISIPIVLLAGVLFLGLVLSLRKSAWRWLWVAVPVGLLIYIGLGFKAHPIVVRPSAISAGPLADQLEWSPGEQGDLEIPDHVVRDFGAEYSDQFVVPRPWRVSQSARVLWMPGAAMGIGVLLLLMGAFLGGGERFRTGMIRLIAVVGLGGVGLMLLVYLARGGGPQLLRARIAQWPGLFREWNPPTPTWNPPKPTAPMHAGHPQHTGPQVAASPEASDQVAPSLPADSAPSPAPMPSLAPEPVPPAPSPAPVEPPSQPMPTASESPLPSATDVIPAAPVQPIGESESSSQAAAPTETGSESPTADPVPPGADPVPPGADLAPSSTSAPAGNATSSLPQTPLEPQPLVPVRRAIPDWMTALPPSNNGIIYVKIESELYATLEECRSSLLDAARRAVSDYLVGSGVSFRPRERMLDSIHPAVLRQTIQSEYVEEVPLKSLNGAKVMRLWALLKLTPELQQAVESAWRASIIEGRLTYVALGGTVLLLVMAVTFGYLRLDLWTAGLYRMRLRIAAVLALALVCSGAFVVAAALRIPQ